MCQTIVLDQAPVFPLVADNNVIFAIVLEFGSVCWFAVPEIPFTFCLNDVFGYVHGCRSHIDICTLRPSAPRYPGACEGFLTGPHHSGIRVLSPAPQPPEGSPHASIADL